METWPAQQVTHTTMPTTLQHTGGKSGESWGADEIIVQRHQTASFKEVWIFILFVYYFS